MAAPCLWDLAGQTDCCGDFWDTLTPEEQAAATSAATFVVWAATGRQYGPCELTVRPCGRDACDQGVANWGWFNGIWTPFVYGGQWFNGCGCWDICHCGPSDQIYLPGPVASVSQVLMDGVIVDPNTYRVDSLRYLVRTGVGNSWPWRQNFDVDSGPDTLFVTYLRGTPVPAYLLNAAGTYACQWAKMCRNEPCQIPTRVVTLTRQGTTFDGVDIDALLERGLTGVTAVDQIITAVNPYGLKGRTRILSPDSDYPIMTTSP